MVAHNVTSDHVLANRVAEANTFGRRLRGLMFRSGLADGEGILLRPCTVVHTHFMRFPIDVIFLDAQWRVVRVVPPLAPWRLSPEVPEAVCALEVAAGAAGPTRPGDTIELQW